MVMHSQTAETLHALLNDMEYAIVAIEELIPLEQAAIGQLNGEEIIKLTEKRGALWKELQNSKLQCQKLFQQHNMPLETELSQFIDMHLAEDATELQQQRQDLNDRIIIISKSNEFNAIRLKAAADTVTGTLKGLGLLESKNTYGQDGSL